jgi:hypothetical protein
MRLGAAGYSVIYFIFGIFVFTRLGAAQRAETAQRLLINKRYLLTIRVKIGLLDGELKYWSY